MPATILLQCKLMPLRTEVDWLYGFIFQSPWRSTILKKHPGLVPVLTIQTEAKRVAFIRAYVREMRHAKRREIAKATAAYQALWHRIGKQSVAALTHALQTPLTRDKSATALVSLDPICPRFLSSWSFAIYFDYRKPEHAAEVILHEICHFLYFRKWHSVFPEHDAKRFEAPDLVWHLSELMAPIILNDADVNAVWGGRAVFYPEHMRLRIGGVPVPTLYARMYRKWKTTNTPFADFLRQAFAFTQQHRATFTKSAFSEQPAG